MKRETYLTEPDEADYARLGRYTAALLGSQLTWDGGDTLEDLAGAASRYLGATRAVGDQSPDQLKLWRNVADELGLGLDFDDECRECGEPNDDGEGQDGWCGNCADRHTCWQCGDTFEYDELAWATAAGTLTRVCDDCRREGALA